MTWRTDAATRILKISKDFPADMPLNEKRRVLNEAGNFFAGGTHYPRKAWAKAQREILEKYHGQPKGWGKHKAVTTALAGVARGSQRDLFMQSPKPEPKGSLL